MQFRIILIWDLRDKTMADILKYIPNDLHPPSTYKLQLGVGG